MKKNIIVFVLIAAVIFILCSCSAVNTENVLDELTSVSYKGRMGGTEGGIKTAEYIKDVLESFGMDVREQNFCGKTFDPSKTVSSFVIEGDNKKICLLYEDYCLGNITDNVNISADITFNKDDKYIKDKIFVTDDIKNVRDLNETPKAVLIKKDSLIKYMDINDGGIPLIYISNDVYAGFKGGEKISIYIDTEFLEGEYKNIIATVKGKDSKTATVISAHFDGCGHDSAGVFKGAVDNVSGVSALIFCIEELCETLKNEKPKNDIVFAFFDGEEQGLKGSSYFINESVYEKIININIDCIEKGENVYIQHRGENDLLAKEVSEYIKGSYVSKAAGVSDDLAFGASGHDAVLITTLKEGDIGDIHTVGDTKEDVDVLALKALGGNLSRYIREKLF